MPDAALVGMAGIVTGGGLTKRYTMGQVEVLALRGVDIDLNEGELVVLLGASGASRASMAS